MIIDKTLILNKIKKHYSFKNDADFARFLEIKPQTLSSWYSRNTFDIELLYAKCVGIDGNFLITGQGDLFPKNELSSLSEPKTIYENIDPGYEAFLKYLGKEESTKKIIEILKKWKEADNGKNDTEEENM